MNMLENMNSVVAYIEAHLCDDIDPLVIERLAGCSAGIFSRFFAYAAGIPLSEYIRRRRLTLAAHELMQSDARIIDIALKYGYDSPVSFARAFSTVHGVTPSQARSQGTTLVSFPPVRFFFTIKGECAMNYRIETKEPMKLFGVRRHFTTENGSNFIEIPKFWDECQSNGTAQQMMQLAAKSGCFGVCSDFADDRSFDYGIAMFAGDNIGSFERLDVPSFTWAVFECVGPMPDSMQSVWKRIFTEWFPDSGYRHANGPELEWYSQGDNSADDYYSEIWIPIEPIAK